MDESSHEVDMYTHTNRFNVGILSKAYTSPSPVPKERKQRPFMQAHLSPPALCINKEVVRKTSKIVVDDQRQLAGVASQSRPVGNTLLQGETSCPSAASYPSVLNSWR